MEYRFAVTFEGDQGKDDAADADLFSEDPLLSAAPDSALVDTTMQSTSMERSPVDRLFLDPPSGKSMDVFGIEL